MRDFLFSAEFWYLASWIVVPSVLLLIAHLIDKSHD